MSSQTTDSLERFAELCAALDDGFAERVTVLSDAGLDEAAWERAQAYWTSQIRDDAGDTMAARFGAAYAARRRALMHGLPRASSIAPRRSPLSDGCSVDGLLEVTLDAPIGAPGGPVSPFVP